MKTFRIYLAAVALTLGSLTQASGQTGADEARILSIVEVFFDALEKQDTAVISRICLKEARNYSIRDAGDSAVVRSQPSTEIRFSPNQILKERIRKPLTEVKVAGRIAMVWAPYDLWVNDTFSHCGVDVFTMLHTSDGWKIASIAWTVETDGCK